MRTTYNRIAGRNVERLAALSDGVFAVAMTLLVLDLHAPAVEAVSSEQALWSGIRALAPRLLMFAMTFLTLGITKPGDLRWARRFPGLRSAISDQPPRRLVHEFRELGFGRPDRSTTQS